MTCIEFFVFLVAGWLLLAILRGAGKGMRRGMKHITKGGRES